MVLQQIYVVIKSLGSSNGRTPASEAGNIGSTPLPKKQYKEGNI